ncbi:hypothetical protein D3C71_942500 [compost metagenome]
MPPIDGYRGNCRLLVFLSLCRKVLSTLQVLLVVNCQSEHRDWRSYSGGLIPNMELDRFHRSDLTVHAAV